LLTVLVKHMYPTCVVVETTANEHKTASLDKQKRPPSTSAPAAVTMRWRRC